MPAAAAGLLLVLALLPSPAAAGDGDEERLPFLLADGAVRAVGPVAPPLLPVWAPASDGAGAWEYEWEFLHSDPRRRDERTKPVGPAHPDAWALFRDVPGASLAKGGRVVFDGAAEDRARWARLVAALHAGFGRSARVEVGVRWGPEQERVALSGEAPLGCLLEADARESRDYPAGLDVGTVSACAQMLSVQVGPRVVASAVAAGDGFVLRLALHVSRVVDDVRFEAERLTLVAPALAFTALVAEVPAAPGEREAIRCGDLTVTYRVTPLPSAAPPPGTRVFSLDATVPLFGVDPLPEPGVVSRDDRANAAGQRPRRDAEPRLSDVGAGIRRHDVPPGLVVLEGDEGALEAVVERWRAELADRRAPLRLVLRTGSGVRLDVPLAPPARLVFATGRLDPVVAGLRSEVSDSVAAAGTSLDEVFTGQTLTVSFEDGGWPRLEEAWAASVRVRPRSIPIVVNRRGVAQRDLLPGSRWAPTVTRASRPCRPEEVRAWKAER